MKLSFPTSIVLCTALVACTTAPAADTTENADSSSSMSSVSSVRETNNVSYIGMVKPAGISIYSEGTHRLVLETEKIILLESSTVDLNG